MEGKPIRARSVRVGDVIMNEWTQQRMTVAKIEVGRAIRSHGRSHKEVSLYCIKPDGTNETLRGNYWYGRTRLISREKGK